MQPSPTTCTICTCSSTRLCTNQW